MTESSTLDHPAIDWGLSNSNSTLAVGDGGATGAVVAGGASSVVTEVSVDGVERVSELQELRKSTHESDSAESKRNLRISILTPFARAAKRLIGFALCFAFGNRLTSVALRAAPSKTEFDLRSTT